MFCMFLEQFIFEAKYMTGVKPNAMMEAKEPPLGFFSIPQALPLQSCRTFGKSLNFPKAQFSTLENHCIFAYHMVL